MTESICWRLDMAAVKTVRTGKGDTGISTPAPNQIRYTKTKETRRRYSRSRTNEKERRINKKENRRGRKVEGGSWGDGRGEGREGN